LAKLNHPGQINVIITTAVCGTEFHGKNLLDKHPKIRRTSLHNNLKIQLPLYTAVSIKLVTRIQNKKASRSTTNNSIKMHSHPLPKEEITVTKYNKNVDEEIGRR